MPNDQQDPSANNSPILYRGKDHDRIVYLLCYTNKLCQPEGGNSVKCGSAEETSHQVKTSQAGKKTDDGGLTVEFIPSSLDKSSDGGGIERLMTV